MQKKLLLSLIGFMVPSASGFAMKSETREKEEETSSVQQHAGVESVSSALTLTPSHITRDPTETPSLFFPDLSKVTPAQWEEVEKGLICPQYFIGSCLNVPEQLKLMALNRTIFDKYFNLYQTLYGSNKHLKKKIWDHPEKNFLEPFGRFVIAFENFFDQLRTGLRQNASDGIGKQALLDELFLITQRTFNVCVNAYQERYPKDSLNKNMAPFTHNGQPFSLIQDTVRKHLYHTKNARGYVPFTIFPQESKRIGETLYETYIPYGQTDESDIFCLFSLDQKRNPLLYTGSGFILQKLKIGPTAKVYRGNTSSVPYTMSQNITFLEPHTQTTQALEDLNIITMSKSHQENTEIPETQTQTLPQVSTEAIQELSAVFPEEIKGHPIYHIGSYNPFMMGNMRDKLIQLLGESDTAFIPFPRTPLEELEQTYHYILYLTSDPTQLTAEDKVSIQSLEKLFGEPLNQIADTYQQKILATYQEEERAKETVPSQEMPQPSRKNRNKNCTPEAHKTLSPQEETTTAPAAPQPLTKKQIRAQQEEQRRLEQEERIRLEQEQRSKMVIKEAQDEQQQTSSNQKLPTQRPEETQETLLSSSSSSSSSSSHTPAEPSSNPIYQRALKRLEQLQKTPQQGALKFRKFMQLINIAHKALGDLGESMSMQLNKSSHGKIETEENVEGLVRPHKKPKDQTLHLSSQSGPLTNLVGILMNKLEKHVSKTNTTKTSEHTLAKSM